MRLQEELQKKEEDEPLIRLVTKHSVEHFDLQQVNCKKNCLYL